MKNDIELFKKEKKNETTFHLHQCKENKIEIIYINKTQ